MLVARRRTKLSVREGHWDEGRQRQVRACAELAESAGASTRPADFIAGSDDMVRLQKICDFCMQRTWAASGKTQVCSELMGR